MATILCIETSASVCSVAIWSTSGGVIHEEVHEDANDHAKVLSPLIDSSLKTASLTLSSLDAIAVSAGPGSYTGLRIGTSTAKGLCYALDIPLIAIDTLKIMASQMVQESSETYDWYIPMIDARRMEVFFGTYNRELDTLTAPQPRILDDDFFDAKQAERILVGGSGSPKLETLNLTAAYTLASNISPRAIHMGPLAALKYDRKEFEDVAYFEPSYTKAFYTPKKAD